jgi:hypothetical protein
MKLKLDLHPIFSDSRKIEQGLIDVMAEAVAKKATEVEIIPGKGSGALKKTVLRFLLRPEIKKLYHRVEKDDENFGRIFVHFRHSEPPNVSKAAAQTAVGPCFCCQTDVVALVGDEILPGERIQIAAECGSCGSPNRMVITLTRTNKLIVTTQSGYEDSQ